ncbi:MAG: YraN family protein [Coriobacteriales bacterium]|nr:YraN family protein [Coriobacteriales bacterium]
MLEEMDLGGSPLTNGKRDVHIQYEQGALGSLVKESSSKQVGAYGEDIACAYLEQCGLVIVERNWHCRFGEVDIVARDGNTIVLVEVKTRRVKEDREAPFPEIAVDSRKRARYEKLALLYLSWHKERMEIRFDVVAICLAGECDSYLRHYVGAFGWDE